MEEKKVLVLSVKEATEALVKFYTDVLVTDPSNTTDLVRDGGLGKLPVFPQMTPKQIAELYGELCLAELLLEADPTLDLVVVQTGDYQYEFVGEKHQLHLGKGCGTPTTTEALQAVAKVQGSS